MSKNNVKMELKGMDELQRRIEEMGRKGARISNEALKKGAQPILDEAKLNAPKDTGKGVEGLTIGRPRKKGDKRSVLVGIDRGDISEVFYMKFHEFGTSKMTARPFLGPAYEKNKDKASKIIMDEIKKGLGL